MDSRDTEFRVEDLIMGEVSYTEAEKKLRDRFVIEYLKDYNAYSAATRLGFMDETAQEFAKQVFNEPYVQRAITSLEEARSAEFHETHDNLLSIPQDFKPHDAETDRERIKSGLFREAFFTGAGSSHASRVSALTTLSRIYGLDKQEEKKEAVRSNVMVVPAMGSLDSWEQNAKESQTKLMETVKE